MRLSDESHNWAGDLNFRFLDFSAFEFGIRRVLGRFMSGRLDFLNSLKGGKTTNFEDFCRFEVCWRTIV